MDNIPASSSPLPKSTNVNGKITWPKASSTKQQPFSFPDSLIYYITKNPATPKVYLKLAKSCKYFFEKNPLLIVRRIHGDGRKFCSNDGNKCYDMEQKCCINIDLTKIHISKIWLTHRLELSDNVLPLNIASIIVPKIYRCENAKLLLHCDEITWEEFKQFATVFQRFFIYYTRIIDHDENNVMIESILKVIPNVTNFHYTCDVNNPSVNASTMKNISQLQNLGNLRHFSLNHIPEVIAVRDFANFIKDLRHTTIRFDFYRIIYREYKEHLDQWGDEIIASEAANCLIRYYGQKEEKYMAMLEKCSENPFLAD